jgi:hypothetical protein
MACRAGQRPCAAARAARLSPQADAARDPRRVLAAASVTGHSARRILRYPSGLERVLEYPSAQDEGGTEAWEDGLSIWTLDSQLELLEFDAEECSLAGAACVMSADPLAEELSTLQHRKTATSEAELVRSSFRLLKGSPWLTSRPLFVLAQQVWPTAVSLRRYRCKGPLQVETG